MIPVMSVIRCGDILHSPSPSPLLSRHAQRASRIILAQGPCHEDWCNRADLMYALGSVGLVELTVVLTGEATIMHIITMTQNISDEPNYQTTRQTTSKI